MEYIGDPEGIYEGNTDGVKGKVRKGPGIKEISLSYKVRDRGRNRFR